MIDKRIRECNRNYYSSTYLELDDDKTECSTAVEGYAGLY